MNIRKKYTALRLKRLNDSKAKSSGSADNLNEILDEFFMPISQFSEEKRYNPLRMLYKRLKGFFICN
ncbi:MAG: hypothetical protein GX102_11225 [Porphyromonadaceae bacterium]|nr:hypothetical protein [Porphyromonadaceae bacterium]